MALASDCSDRSSAEDSARNRERERACSNPVVLGSAAISEQPTRTAHAGDGRRRLRIARVLGECYVTLTLW